MTIYFNISHDNGSGVKQCLVSPRRSSTATREELLMYSAVNAQHREVPGSGERKIIVPSDAIVSCKCNQKPSQKQIFHLNSNPRFLS